MLIPRSFVGWVEVLGTLIAIALILLGCAYALRRHHSPAQIIIKLIITVPFALFILVTAIHSGPYAPLYIGVMGVILSIVWTPHIAELVSSPLTSLFDGGSTPPDPKPLYSIAISKRKRGQYADAIAAVREQLVKFPGDFEGTLLLASIQAENLQDLSAADNTLNQACTRDNLPTNHVASAYTAMADWHLKLGLDVDAARVCLQKIIDRFPGTEFALHAQQRRAHLVETEQMLLAQSSPKPVHVPEGIKNLGLKVGSAGLVKAPEIEPGKQAAAYVQHLSEHPHDSEVREKLAMLYAREFSRLDLATMEINQLLAEPRHSPKQMAAWLNLLANFQIDAGADVVTVTATLQQIVDRFPDLPLADITRRRLVRVNSEIKAKSASTTVKLGEYEQNVGLKYGGLRKL